MRFTITIDCDNAAFEEEPALEVSAILARLAVQLQEEARHDPVEGGLWDSNGNRVGEWGFGK